jgi:hypothetical protein
MKVAIHTNLQDPRVIEATRVVIYDSLDNPVAFALQYGTTPDGRELIMTAHVAEPGGVAAFNRILKEMGINKTVIVVDAPQGTPLDQVRFESV